MIHEQARTEFFPGKTEAGVGGGRHEVRHQVGRARSRRAVVTLCREPRVVRKKTHPLQVRGQKCELLLITHFDAIDARPPRVEIRDQVVAAVAAAEAVGRPVGHRLASQ